MAQRHCALAHRLVAALCYVGAIVSKAAPLDPDYKSANTTEKCYKCVGCFNSLDDTLMHPAAFPANPASVKTTFKLFSRQNRGIFVELQYCAGRTLRGKSQFQKKKPLIFLVHGYTQSGTDIWIQDIKNALLNEADCNVIIVDWGIGARGFDYLKAVANTALVGREMFLLLQRLMKRHPTTLGPDQVHVIGFSLGAHVAGFFARNFKRATGQTIWRITALDPAGPLFAGTRMCVSKEDARFVDVIHTSAMPCYHLRATAYFLESLRNKKCKFVSATCEDGFLAMKRGSCETGADSGLMGYYSYKAAGRGVQMLLTNARPEYCNSTKGRMLKSSALE
ncbi:pancreatic triacylglycerol lipase isoform X2 [Rhipicephalus sanguineus]|uniref:pancreatic triacylglycerol lipase isoform X2 n=1 Tax=Rhipicephalus sanguineus TaxID=34632 RepID=UPI0020C5415E|nr:pancreatic triacylglycerol lipase isoform X2 [Rhipicephalus sanguineus]